MHSLLRPTTAELKGIFLIDQDKLLALDELLQSQFKELKKLKKAAIDREVKKQIADSRIPRSPEEIRKQIAEGYQFRDEYAAVKIDGSDETFSSFQEAITSGKLEHVKPRSFDAYFVAGEKSVGVSMEFEFTSKKIKISVTPPDLLQGRAVLDLKSWGERQKQSWIVNVWAEWWLPLIIATFSITLVLLALTSTSDYNQAKQILLYEAAGVLQEGVSEQNRDRAIETILRWQTGILREPVRGTISWVSPWLIGISHLVAITLFFSPKSAIGIGRGKKSIYWQNLWLWFVLKVVIGTVVFSTLLLGLLRKLVLG